ncbi:MAG: hypothetical protein POELPBGB_01102 [Bacteroidia bacterium]|nr:hypothetical protein [Bacteroidia bacterium]
MKYVLAILILLAASVIPSYSQEEEITYVTIFRSIQLINMQTAEVIPQKGFDFSIRHRFGMIGADSSVYQQFLGLDLPANIRFGFAFPILKNLYVGAGRTKTGKTIDLEAKYLFLRQTEDNKMPFSIAAYFNTGIMTDKFPKVPDYAYFSDNTTPFEYKFSHRLGYNIQLIFARKFSERISFQIAPVLIYKNLVAAGAENHTFSIPVGGAIKTSLKSSVIFEYAYRFNNRPEHNDYPLSIAWESGTVGHTFQIVISSSNELLEQETYTKKSFNYLKGNFALGFNMRRVFWYKKKKLPPQ